jgi:hypothetical protein
VALPGGRRYHVMTLIAGRLRDRWVKLGRYEFDEDGTCGEQYWIWRQTQNGPASVVKVPTGYRTAGCQADCAVHTPRGFQPGWPPAARAGTWREVTGGILVTWSDGGREAWSDRTEPGGPLSRHELNPGSSTRPDWAPAAPYWFGRMYGSNTPLSAGADRQQVVDTDTLLVTDWLYDPYFPEQTAQAPLRGPVGKTIAYWSKYLTCTHPGVLALRNENFRPGASDAQQNSWWHSYWVFDPARNGRKVYWQQQLGSVANAELAQTALCISPGGGHTLALLQVLTDDSRFFGLVGVEASLVNLQRGGAYAASLVLEAREEAVAGEPVEPAEAREIGTPLAAGEEGTGG